MVTPAAALRSETLDRIMRDYEAVAARLPDTAVPRAARAHAMRELSRLGWPRASDEQWRYTNLRAFEAVAAFGPAALGPRAGAPASDDAGAIAWPPPLPGFERLVYLDGVRHSAGAGAGNAT